jgi:hypothetical protein
MLFLLFLLLQEILFCFGFYYLDHLVDLNIEIADRVRNDDRELGNQHSYPYIWVDTRVSPYTLTPTLSSSGEWAMIFFFHFYLLFILYNPIYFIGYF